MCGYSIHPTADGPVVFRHGDGRNLGADGQISAS